jgi:DNA polymerase-3 subunit epsilon
MIRSYSALVAAPANEAEHVNGIPAEVLRSDDVRPRQDVIRVVKHMVQGCAAIMSHGADFDRKWLPELKLPWICSMDDIEWPCRSSNRALSTIAIAHGVGVVSAHRALDDVMTLVRLLERVELYGVRLEELLARAMRPKTTIRSCQPFEQNDLARAAGFRFDSERKMWIKRIAAEDLATAEFPFRIQELP